MKSVQDARPALLRRRSLLAAAALALPKPSFAQSWPTRPVRIILSLGSGSTMDVITRLVSAQVSAALGEPFIVEPRPGAGGTIAGDAIAKALPDGHTLGVFSVQSHAVAPSVYPAVSYDPVRDFTHIAMMAELPLVLGVSAASPMRSLDDFVAAARTPTGLTVGTNGNGSSAHATIERLRLLAGLHLTHVPYRGSNAPAVADVIAGRLDAIIPSMPDVAGNDRIRLLAISLPQRLAGWPEVPTFRELGFPEMVSSVWISLGAPAGLQDSIADRLHTEVQAALARPEVAGRLAALGSGPNRGLGRAALTAHVAQENARWGELVRVAGIRAE